jgi:hypothetical protein
MKTVVNNLEAHFKIKAMQEFRTTSVRDRDSVLFGVPRLSGGFWRSDAFGRLPEQYWTAVARAQYVVWSYATPIGWVNDDGTTTVPDVGYSLTTGQHQMIVKYAFGVRSFPARGRELRPAGGGPREGGIDA